MSKNLKKILVTGASLLMFASVGAGAGNLAHADVPSYTGMARTTKRLTARRVLYYGNGYHLGMRARLPKGSRVRVVGTLNAEDYNIDIPGRMGTYELNGFDVSHASGHHRRSHKSSFSAWFQLEHLFNRYGTRRHGHSAMIGGRRFTLATNISGAIENGRHISNDNNALRAMKYAINHPVRHYRKRSVKHYKRSIKRNKRSNKRRNISKKHYKRSKKHVTKNKRTGITRSHYIEWLKVMDRNMYRPIKHISAEEEIGMESGNPKYSKLNNEYNNWEKYDNALQKLIPARQYKAFENNLNK